MTTIPATSRSLPSMPLNASISAPINPPAPAVWTTSPLGLLAFPTASMRFSAALSSGPVAVLSPVLVASGTRIETAVPSREKVGGATWSPATPGTALNR